MGFMSCCWPIAAMPAKQATRRGQNPTTLPHLSECLSEGRSLFLRNGNRNFPLATCLILPIVLLITLLQVPRFDKEQSRPTQLLPLAT